MRAPLCRALLALVADLDVLHNALACPQNARDGIQ